MVLKGAYLAEAVYGDVALRPMRDLDLLVVLEGLQAELSRLIRENTADEKVGALHASRDPGTSDPVEDARERGRVQRRLAESLPNVTSLDLSQIQQARQNVSQAGQQPQPGIQQDHPSMARRWRP